VSIAIRGGERDGVRLAGKGRDDFNFDEWSCATKFGTVTVVRAGLCGFSGLLKNSS